jgi:hypothetical protein
MVKVWLLPSMTTTSPAGEMAPWGPAVVVIMWVVACALLRHVKTINTPSKPGRRHGDIGIGHHRHNGNNE